MKNQKIIGLIGGVRPQSTNYIYKKIISLSQKKYGAKNNDDYPEMVIHSIPIPDFISDKEKVKLALTMLISCKKNWLKLLKLNLFPQSSLWRKNAIKINLRKLLFWDHPY